KNAENAKNLFSGSLRSLRSLVVKYVRRSLCVRSRLTSHAARLRQSLDARRLGGGGIAHPHPLSHPPPPASDYLSAFSVSGRSVCRSTGGASAAHDCAPRSPHSGGA